MISVIIPVYNAEKYIDKCISSVLEQIYKEFELILINDGSTDKSAEKCDAWFGKDSRIRVIHKDNGGIASVRNLGLSLAMGDYIAWVDSDDYVAPDFLSHMYTTLQTNQADMVICGFYTDVDGIITHEGKDYFYDAVYSRQEFLERVYTYGMYSIMCNKLLHKDAYKKIVFPEDRIFEDSSVMRNLAEACEKIVVTERPLYFYRRHGSSITLQKKREEDNLRYMLQFCTWLQKDIQAYEQEGNERLRAYASKHLCDAILQYSAYLSREGTKEGKKLYKKYFRNILWSKDISLGSQLKYAVARMSFSLYRKLWSLVHKLMRI